MKPKTEPPASILFCKKELIEKVILEHLKLFVSEGAQQVSFYSLISAPGEMDVTLEDAVSELLRRDKK